MELKKILNDYHLQLCRIVQEFCGEFENAEKCFSSMMDTSYDDATKDYVYNSMPDMQIIKLDELSKVLNTKREVDYTPSAVDAVCINSENQWFLIEFKNSSFYKNSSIDKDLAHKREGSSVSNSRKKMLSSLWLLFYIYSISGQSQEDITKFSRDNVTYIAVYKQEKNYDIAMLIHNKEVMREHFTPKEYKPYIGYYFKDAYVITEQELRRFIAEFK